MHCPRGLVYPVRDGLIRGRAVAEGDTVTDLLELVKYEPPIPIAMQGEVRPVYGATLHYDIENIKKYPHELRHGEPVVITEKLHGSWCCLGWHPDHGPIVTSKGMSDRGMALILNEANRNNLYVRTWRAFEPAFETARVRLAGEREPFYVLGEVYGRGVQDLHYDEPNPAFRVFDAYAGEPRRGRYLAPDEIEESLSDLFPLVPVLFRGPFSEAVLLEHTSGATVPRRQACARRRGGEARGGAGVRRVRARDPEEHLRRLPDAQGRHGVQLAGGRWGRGDRAGLPAPRGGWTACGSPRRYVEGREGAGLAAELDADQVDGSVQGAVLVRVAPAPRVGPAPSPRRPAP